MASLTQEQKASKYDEQQAKVQKYFDDKKLLLAKCKKLGIVNTQHELDEFQKNSNNVNVSNLVLTIKK
jgi:hypothetical protein